MLDDLCLTTIFVWHAFESLMVAIIIKITQAKYLHKPTTLNFELYKAVVYTYGWKSTSDDILYA